MNNQIKYGGFVFEKEEKAAIDRVLKRNWWLLAEEGDAFEKELAEYVGVKHAIFVNSGSSALLLAFQALGRKRGVMNEIIVPATCFPTDISALAYSGFKPVLVDVDLDTFLIDPVEAEKAITERTFGILAVHVAGNVCDLDRLNKICYDHGLTLIEDNCDGLGGDWGETKVGSSSISVASFHAAHIISTGQGGAIFTNDDAEAAKIRELRDWGRKGDFDDNAEGVAPLPKDYMQRYTYTEMGFNLSPIELQAAIGREQLKKIDRFKASRKHNFEFLKKGLEKLGYSIVNKYDKADPCWFTIPLLVPKEKKRSVVFEALKKANIEFRNVLASNIKLQPGFRFLYGKFPNADEIAKRGLWLPVHPNVTQEDLEYILKTLKI